MFLVSTRNFPPELGGMQNLMEGLSNALINHGPVKVFADNHEHADKYDKNPDRVASIVFVSTIMSLLTIPFILYFLMK